MKPTHKKTSRKLFEAVKLSDYRQYEIAQKVGMNNGTLSAIINNILIPPLSDTRIIEIGAFLGLSPDECYED